MMNFDNLSINVEKQTAKKLRNLKNFTKSLNINITTMSMCFLIIFDCKTKNSPFQMSSLELPSLAAKAIDV